MTTAEEFFANTSYKNRVLAYVKATKKIEDELSHDMDAGQRNNISKKFDGLSALLSMESSMFGGSSMFSNLSRTYKALASEVKNDFKLSPRQQVQEYTGACLRQLAFLFKCVK